MSQEPKRWLSDVDDAPSGFAEAGEAYKAQGPSPEQMQSMLIAAQAAQLATPWWLLKRLWLPVGALAVLGASYVLGTRPQTAVQPRALPPVTSIPAPRVEAAVEPAPVAPIVVEEDAGRKAQALREPVDVKPRPLRTAKPVEPAPSSPVVSETNPGAELALLKRARGLLAATKPEEALTLMDQHAARFPQGMFVQERELLAVEALAQLGRPQETHTRAAAFLRAHPKSVHAARIRAIDDTQTR